MNADTESHMMVGIADGKWTCWCGDIHASTDQRDVFIHIGCELQAERDAALARVRELEALLAESRRSHYYCEDCWYSCPKAPDGCCNDAAGDECDCGADEWNARIAGVLETPEDTP